MTQAASLLAGMVPPHTRHCILVRGAVQGVGFRPFIYRQAIALGLSGWIGNSAAGVTMEVEGRADSISDLLHRIRHQPPPNAIVDEIESRIIEPRYEAGFVIRASMPGGPRTARPLPDLATCAQCLAELFDRGNRRYRYPFINCTQCGPRYSIIEDIPYDRARTTMRHFPMCGTCMSEYDDPADRRHHAEPNACPVCGPHIELWHVSGRMMCRDDTALQSAAATVRAGGIVAMKGIGGFHLIVDARNERAVRRLRARKNRPDKPFAVMFPSFERIQATCRVSGVEEDLLLGPAHPITLLWKTTDSVARAVAPDNPWLGVMLPYAPLHHLLMHDLNFPIVATSGNVADEPIVIDNAEAVQRLANIADCFLLHDRPIVRPLDDSVVRDVCGREMNLRRGRGYAPTILPMQNMTPGILAVGGQQKNTVALTTQRDVILSEHIGDLGTMAARNSQAAAIAAIARLSAVRPRRVAQDLHPDDAAHRGVKNIVPAGIAVQHHLAHIVSCMAEHGIAGPVLGVAWDGTGHGTDGIAWGGEFLLVSRQGWKRVAHVRNFRLPGGDVAAREPRRAAFGLLHAAFGARVSAMTDLPPVAAFSEAERAVLCRMLDRQVNAPLTSSAGRLFDAFAALAGLRQRTSYEGQAATALENAVDADASDRGYEFPVRESAPDPDCLIVDWQPALEQAVAEIRAGATAGAISGALHRGLAAAIATIAARVDAHRVVLSGGCFQNARLTEAAVVSLRAAGCEPIWHRRIPPNDGGLALGQAVWAAWQGELPCV